MSLVFIALVEAQGISNDTLRQEPGERATLKLGEPIRATISALEQQSFQIDLKSGQHVQLTLSCQGTPVSFSVFDPIIDRGLQGGRQMRVPATAVLALSVEHTATYQINITTQGKHGQIGRYELVAVLIGHPDEEFNLHVRAQDLITDTWLLYSTGTQESNHRTIEKGQEALSLLARLGMQYYEWEINYLIGDTSISIGEYQEALRFLNQALHHARALQLGQKQAETLTSIGQVYNSLGDYEKGLTSFQQALPLWEQDEYLETPVNLIGWTLLSIGSTYSLIGEREKAIEYFNQSTTRYQEHNRISTNIDPTGYNHEFHRGMTMVNSGLGTIYAKLGDKQKALDYFTEMRNQVRQTNWWNGEAQALNNIAHVYVSLGEFQSALEKYEEALSIARKAGERLAEAEVLVSLGSYYRLANDFTRAQEYLQQALDIYRAIGAKRAQAVALTNLGALSNTQDNPQQALLLCQEALQLRQEIGDRYGEGSALNELGITYEALGDQSQAITLFTHALELRRRTGDREGEANTLYHLARLAQIAGNLKEAQARIEVSLSLTEAIRGGILSQELRASYLSAMREHYEFYIELLMELHRKYPDDGYDAAALQASEMARGRLLLETLAEAHADIRQDAPIELITRERELQQRINAKAEYQFQLQSTPHSQEQRTAVAKDLQTLAEEFQTLQARIKAASPRYAALTEPQPFTTQEIQQQVLDGQTLLLEYALGKKRSYLWAVTPTSLHSYELPPQAEIEKLAQHGYELLTARNKKRDGESAAQRRERIAQVDAEWKVAADKLSQMLLAPAASDIVGKRLLIVGQGALQYIPFNALPVPMKEQPKQGRGIRQTPTASRRVSPLIVEHEIVVLPSASLLTQLRRENTQPHGQSRSVAIFADPVFTANDERVRRTLALPSEPNKEKKAPQPATIANLLTNTLSNGKIEQLSSLQPGFAISSNDTTLSANIPRLYATRQEADAISSLLPADRQFRALDFAANRATATSPKLGQYQILHFATHALIDNLHPGLSGILLSLVDEQGQPQDGFLRAHEIYNLKLPAELVVLSACQTGLGKQVKGEGLISLTHSFMYAGAEHVAVSLWELDDKATADLMADFYQGLLGSKQLSLAAALRGAQIKAWSSGRWPSPYFWAGFILQGDWR